MFNPLYQQTLTEQTSQKNKNPKKFVHLCSKLHNNRDKCLANQTK